MKKIIYALLISMVILFVSCSGGSSSSGPDGGVSGPGFYDYFNGHTWSYTNEAGDEKTSYIFANGKVIKKTFSKTGSSWNETNATSEKNYTLTKWTDAGLHGTITTEDLSDGNPTLYSFTSETTVVLSYNGTTSTYTREN